MANSLKILAPLSASAGVAISGSDGLQVQQGNINLNSAGEISQTGGIVKVSGDLQVSSGHFKVGNNVESLIANVSTGLVTASSGLVVTGSTGLIVQQGGLNVQTGGASITGQVDVYTGLVVHDSALQVTNGGISGSSTLQVGGTSTLSGAVTAKNGLTVTGSTTVTQDLTVQGSGSVAGDLSITGNLTVYGTTTTVASQNVTIKDKNVILGVPDGGATATDAGADGGGITLSGSTDKTFQWSNSTDSWTSSENLDLASGKTFKINGTTVLDGSSLGSGITSATGLTSLGTITSLTASALNVTGLTKLDGDVNLGNGSSDIITAAGQLTASEGINLATGKILKIGGQGVVSDYVQGLSGFGGGANSYISASYLSYGTIPGALYTGHISASGYQLDSDVLQLSFNGQFAQGYGLIIDNEKATLTGDDGNSISVYTASSDIVINSHQVHFGGQDVQNGQNLSASFWGRIYGGLVDGNQFNFVTTSSYNDYRNNNFNVIDVVTAIDELDSKLHEVSNSVGSSTNTVSKSNYYSLRVATKGTTQNGGGGIVRFFLSGSPGTVAQNEGNTSQVTASCPLGLSGSTGAECLANFAYASLDVAVQINNLWTNDLVSVQVSASQSGSTGPFYPFVTVEAPALSDGTPIKLIVVQESLNRI